MGSVSVRVFQLVTGGAAAAGVGPVELLAAAGIDPAALVDPDGRLSRALEARRWQARAEPALAQLLDQQLAAQLAALPAEEASFLDRIRSALFAELDRGEPTLEAIAARLRMSPRTLQRRLREEGSSLSAVLDRLRAELALRYLGEPRTSIGEVAFRLGFSDPTTFHRAFRRWTGQTPAEYRRGHRPGSQAAP